MKLTIRELGVIGLALIMAGCATAPRHSAVSPPQESEGSALDAEYNVALPEVKLTPDILYKLLVAETALQRGHYAVGMTQYFELAQQTRDPRVAARASRIAVFIRDRRHALRAAQLWVEIDPNNLAARQAISAAYIRSGNADKALEHLEFVLAAAPNDPERGFMTVASLLGREQDLQSAVAVMGRLVESHRHSAAAWYAYAHLALRANMLDRAESGVLRSLKLQADNPGAIILRSRILQLNEDKNGALTYLGQQVRAYPGKSLLRLTYARQLVDSRRYEEAFNQYQVVIKQTPDDVDVLFALGLLALQLDRREAAFEYLVRAKDTGMRVDDARFYLGQLEELRGDVEAALDHYSYVDRGDNLIEARVRQAVITSQQLNDVDRARDYLHSLYTSVPAQKQRIFLVEGDILRGAERYREALALFDHALDEMPGNIPLLYARSLVAERLDMLELAERDLKAILARDPDNVDALNALGYTLADRTDRYREAHDYIKRALDLRPDDNAVLDSMGWVLYRLGKYSQAIKYLRRSLELRLDPEVAAHLGEVLWVTGAQEDAREVWRQALEASPGDKRLLTIMKRFLKQ